MKPQGQQLLQAQSAEQQHLGSAKQTSTKPHDAPRQHSAPLTANTERLMHQEEGLKAKQAIMQHSESNKLSAAAAGIQVSTLGCAALSGPRAAAAAGAASRKAALEAAVDASVDGVLSGQPDQAAPPVAAANAVAPVLADRAVACSGDVSRNPSRPVAVSTHGPMATTTISLNKTIYVPSRLVSTHIQELRDMPPSTNKAVQLQLVLLPPGAADVAADTPLLGVVELSQGVSVRRSKPSKRGGSTYVLSGLLLCQSKPVKEGWHLVGVRYLGGLRLQLLCSPALTPELAKAKRSMEASRQAKRRETRQLQCELERSRWLARPRPADSNSEGSSEAVQSQPNAGRAPSASCGLGSEGQQQSPKRQQQILVSSVDAGTVQQHVEQQQAAVVAKRTADTLHSSDSQAKRPKLSSESSDGMMQPATAADSPFAASPGNAAAVAAARLGPPARAQVASADMQKQPQLQHQGSSLSDLHQSEDRSQLGKLQQQGSSHLFQSATSTRGDDTTAAAVAPLSQRSRWSPVVSITRPPATPAAAEPARAAAAAQAGGVGVEEADHSSSSAADDDSMSISSGSSDDVGHSDQHQQQHNHSSNSKELTCHNQEQRQHLQAQSPYVAPSGHLTWQRELCIPPPPPPRWLNPAVVPRWEQQWQLQPPPPPPPPRLPRPPPLCASVAQSLPEAQRMQLLQQTLDHEDKIWKCRPDGGCKYWSGKPTSCSLSADCSLARTHSPAQPTPWYLARAEVYQMFGVACDAVGRYHAGLVPVPQQPPQQQQGQADSSRERASGIAVRAPGVVACVAGHTAAQLILKPTPAAAEGVPQPAPAVAAVPPESSSPGTPPTQSITICASRPCSPHAVQPAEQGTCQPAAAAAADSVIAPATIASAPHQVVSNAAPVTAIADDPTSLQSQQQLADSKPLQQPSLDQNTTGGLNMPAGGGAVVKEEQLLHPLKMSHPGAAAVLGAAGDAYMSAAVAAATAACNAAAAAVDDENTAVVQSVQADDVGIVAETTGPSAKHTVVAKNDQAVPATVNRNLLLHAADSVAAAGVSELVGQIDVSVAAAASPTPAAAALADAALHRPKGAQLQLLNDQQQPHMQQQAGNRAAGISAHVKHLSAQHVKSGHGFAGQLLQQQESTAHLQQQQHTQSLAPEAGICSAMMQQQDQGSKPTGVTGSAAAADAQMLADSNVTVVAAPVSQGTKHPTNKQQAVAPAVAQPAVTEQHVAVSKAQPSMQEGETAAAVTASASADLTTLATERLGSISSVATPAQLNGGAAQKCGITAPVAVASWAHVPARDLVADLPLPQSVKDNLLAVFDREAVLIVDTLVEMSSADFKDIGVPKGAAVQIMKRCKQLQQRHGR